MPLLRITAAILIAFMPLVPNAWSDDPAINFAAPEFWESVDGEPVAESWEFDGGEIRLIKPRGGKGSLLSQPLPANFELSWQWKIEPRTNSGIKYRVRRFGKQLFSNAYLGVEYQIIDDGPTSVSKGSTASIYDLVPPAQEKNIHPAGQWNESRIVAIGHRLEHYLNGQLVASAVTTGPSWDKTIALSKFYGSQDFGAPADGDRIMLTDHGGKAVFRDFQFTAKTVPDEADEPSKGPFLANAMRNSWADQNSIVIWTRTTAQREMVADGKAFVSLSSKQASKLSRDADGDAILREQLPDGATLSEMLGACPGAPGRVRMTYFPGKNRNDAKTTLWIETNVETDFTAQWKLNDLKPDTQYAAVIEAQSLDGDETTAVVRGAFRTAPKVDAEKNVKFCFTTCHDFIRRDDGMLGHKIYPTMSAMNPDFIVHAGDIEYYDKPDPWAMTVELMRFKWGRIFSLPNNRDFYNKTTSYFLKDDHDTLKNDCWAGQKYGPVTFEEGVRIFNEEQFPTLSPRYTTVRWGRDLQVWFLEGRDYRSPNNMPDGPDKTILGKEQKEWLFRTLDESTAKFKVICSPTPVVGPDRDNKKDNHANEVFAHEGDEIRSHLAKIENVIVLCGDRHWQYASHDPTDNLWEFGCGPGSEKHELGWKEGDERPVHKFLRVAGGFLSGDLRYRGDEKAPTLTIRHHTVTGETLSEFVFPMDKPEADEDSSSE
ncbi:family 16 glycoside hydrolase [Stieleria varia]|uniref:PhoD-like phosphatase n=1 Tax=Stieleria varia TaxID=2528005 RepID=A0A5C6AP20_9BACT|nr:family 16 glycoside hydrolase [Stieleria varia]TWU01171.1 PhoD-like phosphatase [Stieleria varia]